MGTSKAFLIALPMLLIASAATGQEGAQVFRNSDVPRLPPMPARELSPEEQDLRKAVEAEHRRELDALGIAELRPTHDARNPDADNPANYDEAIANRDLPAPDILRMSDGREVATPADWWHERRPEIAEAFAQEIYGRVPDSVPDVSWRVANTQHQRVGEVEAVTREVVGHVDDSRCPDAPVEIGLSVTLPADHAGRVPVIMNLTTKRFGSGAFPRGKNDAPPGPEARAQVLALGWGFAEYLPESVQPDQWGGCVLDRGIIGLTNGCQPREMDQWGALRAWAWGASRALDYLQSDAEIDAGRIGIAGHSRYGKAALLAMATDPRFALAYISASGAGGAKPLRRSYGEALEDLAAAGEFHWMAGNFLKYAADPLSDKDLPVDGDALVALAAPRPLFQSAGSITAGDAWVDPPGLFLSNVRASQVYRLLGAKGMDAETMPEAPVEKIDGDLGWHQHQYNHSMVPGWPAFLRFAQKYFRPNQ